MTAVLLTPARVFGLELSTSGGMYQALAEDDTTHSVNGRAHLIKFNKE